MGTEQRAEPKRLFCGVRKSESSINGTELRPDSGSAASSGSTCDWSFSKSDLYRGAISTPAGAAYLAADTVRCCLPISKLTNAITIRCVSSSALWQYVGLLAESQYPPHIFTRQVLPLRHTKVGFSPLLTRFVPIQLHSGAAAAATFDSLGLKTCGQKSRVDRGRS